MKHQQLNSCLWCCALLSTQSEAELSWAGLHFLEAEEVKEQELSFLGLSQPCKAKATLSCAECTVGLLGLRISTLSSEQCISLDESPGLLLM